MKPRILSLNDVDQAKAELVNINVHPIGIRIMALKAIHRVVKFEGVDPKTANIIKQEMLSRGGEVAVAKTVGNFEDKTTDIIIMGTLAQYIRLIKKLKEQPWGDCQRIGVCLRDLLFKGLDDDFDAVW
jgi:dihydropteroate synthase